MIGSDDRLSPSCIASSSTRSLTFLLRKFVKRSTVCLLPVQASVLPMTFPPTREEERFDGARKLQAEPQRTDATDKDRRSRGRRREKCSFGVPYSLAPDRRAVVGGRRVVIAQMDFPSSQRSTRSWRRLGTAARGSCLREKGEIRLVAGPQAAPLRAKNQAFPRRAAPGELDSPDELHQVDASKRASGLAPLCRTHKLDAGKTKLPRRRCHAGDALQAGPRAPQAMPNANQQAIAPSAPAWPAGHATAATSVCLHTPSEL